MDEHNADTDGQEVGFRNIFHEEGISRNRFFIRNTEGKHNSEEAITYLPQVAL